MAAAFMALADIAVVNLNLPQMQATFGVELEELAWVSTAYMMANVIAMPMTGWLQKRIGLRLAFLASLVVFTGASALCGVAWSFEALVAFRILQGIGGGGLLPLSQAVLGARYPENKFALAGALFGVGALLGPVVGPFLGAEVLEIAAWPWIFWINVPIGIVAIFVTAHTMREGDFERTKTRCRAPIVDLRVFKSSRLAIATGYNFILGAWMLTGGFLNIVYFSTVLALPPLRIGELLLVGNLGDFIVIPLSAWLLERVSTAPLIVAGVLLISAGFWMNAILGLDATFWDLVVPQLVRSAGASFLYVPVTLAAFDRLSVDDRDGAMGSFNLVRELGGSMAIALAAHLVVERDVVHATALAAIASPRSVLAVRGGPSVAERLVGLASFDDVFALGAVVILFSLPLVFWLRTPAAHVPSTPGPLTSP
jgi:DHA2 family multidrug resistance protein